MERDVAEPATTGRTATFLILARHRQEGFVMETAKPQQFASDNYAGICPEAWAAMAEANRGYVPAYGEDPYTDRAAFVGFDMR
jgi:hypothetical protein